METTVPTVSGVTATTVDGTYGPTQTINVTVGFSEAVTVTGTPTLTLETGGTDAVVSYTAGSGTATLSFDYTVAANHINTAEAITKVFMTGPRRDESM